MSKKKNKELQFNGHLVLEPKLKQIAIGLILSDATLQTQSKYKKSYRMKIQMKANKLEFAQKIRQEFTESWIKSAPRFFERKNSKMVEIQTLSTKSLNPLGDLFFNKPSVDPEKEKDYGGHYPKRISSNFVKEHMTSVGLAYWFMGDGSKGDWTPNEGKQIELHTHGFSFLEVEELCKGLRETFGLQAKTRDNKRRKIIQISGDSFEGFLDLVTPELLECFQYRIPSPRKV